MREEQKEGVNDVISRTANRVTTSQWRHERRIKEEAAVDVNSQITS